MEKKGRGKNVSYFQKILHLMSENGILALLMKVVFLPNFGQPWSTLLRVGFILKILNNVFNLN